MLCMLPPVTPSASVAYTLRHARENLSSEAQAHVTMHLERGKGVWWHAWWRPTLIHPHDSCDMNCTST
jgi:hypothetical protein